MKTGLVEVLTLIDDMDERLHVPVPLEEFKDTLEEREKFVAEMLETMYTHRAVGLAANQVGIMRRMFVMDVSRRSLVCFNPIVNPISSDSVLLSEGCLSFPNIYLKIKRPSGIELKYQSITGSEENIVLDGWPSRCAQHETDHLNGVVFTDLVSKLRLQMAKKKSMKV